MRFYYFDFSLLDPTRLLRNLGKSFSGGRPGGGGAAWVTERKGTGNWGGRARGKEWVKNGGGGRAPPRVRGGDWTNRWEAEKPAGFHSLQLGINHMQMRCKNNMSLLGYYS